mmetsp:Transcript_16247/g.41168  ORF Transcript_16247/g.41168 Transcript_16247/m.41168 type:complete len:83 (+) Transcript_16247:1987-2235(+)
MGKARRKLKEESLCSARLRFRPAPFHLAHLNAKERGGEEKATCFYHSDMQNRRLHIFVIVRRHFEPTMSSPPLGDDIYWALV